MIFSGTDGGAMAGATTNAGTAIASIDEKAQGWYLDLGYRVIPNWEMDIRFDRLNRGTEDSANKRRFDTLTLGSQVNFHPKARAIANYEFRWADAPDLPGSNAANQILDGLDNRLSVQVLVIF